jgi:hypothetical protein
MTATYDPSLGDDISRMRQAVGDTDLAEPFEPDVTYTALLLEASDWRLAAAALSRSLAARAINRPSSFTAVGDLTVSWSDRANAWLRLATALETAHARETSAADNSIGFADPVRPDREKRHSGYSNGLRGWR